MGFLAKWIQWTFTLYENAKTNVMVNGAIRTKKFSMERGVKQGCPLAPYLQASLSSEIARMYDFDVFSGTCCP